MCDRCDPNYHGGGKYDPKRSSGSYAQDAEECGKQGDLEGALANWSFAILAARTESIPGNLALRYVDRANLHAEMGNIVLAEADFSEAESCAHEHRNSKTWYDEYVDRDDSNTFVKIAPLLVVYQRRAEMYEELGRHEEAELDWQKYKELSDMGTIHSNSAQD